MVTGGNAMRVQLNRTAGLVRVLTTLWPAAGFGWGNEGHRIVAVDASAGAEAFYSGRATLPICDGCSDVCCSAVRGRWLSTAIWCGEAGMPLRISVGATARS